VRHTPTADLFTLWQTLHHYQPHNLRVLERLGSRVLLMAGADDRHIPAADTAHLAGLLPDARLEIVPRATHALPIRHPDLISNHIAALAAHDTDTFGLASDRFPPTAAHPARSSMSLADAHNTDVRIYHRDGTIFADTRTGAPESLLTLLDGLGLERHQVSGDVWHQVPEALDEIAMKDLVDLAEALVTAVGLSIEVDPGVVGGSAYRAALAAARPPAAGASPARPSRTR
jgi:hypothetical protein